MHNDSAQTLEASTEVHCAAIFLEVSRMRTLARSTTAFVGLILAIMGLRWLLMPGSAAAGLYLELPDDPMAMSTLIGDFSAFFLAGAAMCFMGALRQQANWNYACALLIGGAALFRFLAFLMHGAGLPYELLVVEVVTATLLVWTAPRVHLDRRNGSAQGAAYESEV